MKLRGSLLFAGFFFGLIETFVVASQPFWVIEFFKPATQSSLNLIGEGFTITSLLIDPLAVFLAMFFMGGRFDISFDFSSVLLSFVGGAVLGYLHLPVVDFGLRTVGRPLAALRIPI